MNLMTPQPIRVMIVDDERDVRDALISLMEEDDAISVVGAGGDAEEAIAIAAHEHPDVAILDVRMPRGGGPRAARGITRVSPGTELIALSANDDPNAFRAMLKAGAGTYLVKGVGTEEVLDAIRGCIDGDAARVAEPPPTTVDEQPRPWSERSRRIDAVVRGRGMQVVYQPIFDLANGRPVGAEANTRFRISPRRPPDAWFAEATAAGRGIALELMAIRLAIHGSRQLEPEIALSINASPATCCSPMLGKLLETAAARKVVLEITEHAPVTDYEPLRAALMPVRRRGVDLAIDDTGSGFANLRHILCLRPDSIKLDVCLTKGIEQDPARRSLVEAIVGFAPSIGAKVHAEGIESAEQLDALREAGVDLGQGFFLGRPAPIPTCGTWAPWGGMAAEDDRWEPSGTQRRDRILELAAQASVPHDVMDVLDSARRWQSAHPRDPMIPDVIRIVRTHHDPSGGVR
jgi:EAL domain-containing protein (putative c-di-GMP-specific phosphodiesterase class I)/ActR/RegA family two-component response regulator